MVSQAQGRWVPTPCKDHTYCHEKHVEQSGDIRIPWYHLNQTYLKVSKVQKDSLIVQVVHSTNKTRIHRDACHICPDIETEEIDSFVQETPIKDANLAEELVKNPDSPKALQALSEKVQPLINDWLKTPLPVKTWHSVA